MTNAKELNHLADRAKEHLINHYETGNNDEYLKAQRIVDKVYVQTGLKLVIRFEDAKNSAKAVKYGELKPSKGAKVERTVKLGRSLV